SCGNTSTPLAWLTSLKPSIKTRLSAPGSFFDTTTLFTTPTVPAAANTGMLWPTTYSLGKQSVLVSLRAVPSLISGALLGPIQTPAILGTVFTVSKKVMVVLSWNLLVPLTTSGNLPVTVSSPNSTVSAGNIFASA